LPTLRTLALLLLLLAPSAGRAAGFPMVWSADPRPLPELAFETLDGRPASLAELRGRVVVLNFWATWCTPCREEMPSLDRLQAAFDPAEVAVVALSVDRAGAERVRAFLDEIGVTRLAVYRDPRAATSRAVRLPGLPGTLLVDREGREVGRLLGIAAWDGPEALAAVRRVLDGG
jgi:thiol-disulfide isomerase/thioredoxin